MKKLLGVLFTIISLVSFGQNHVTWEAEVVDNGCEAEVVVTATVEKGWHLYTQYPCDLCFFTPTTIEFDPSPFFDKEGLTSEPETEEHTDEFGELWVQFKSSPVEFRQKIVKHGTEDFDISLYITYQTCNDKMCVQENAQLKITCPGSDCGSAEEATESGSSHAAPTATTEEKKDGITWQLYSKKLADNSFEVIAQAFIPENWSIYTSSDLRHFDFKLSGEGFEFGQPELSEGTAKFDSTSNMEVIEHTGSFTLKQKVTGDITKNSIVIGTLNFQAMKDGKRFVAEESVKEVDLKKAEISSAEENKESRSYWSIFLISFLSGFAALLTPCVFPMIPMTVSFFTKQSKNKAQGIKNAILYGISIIVIYVGLGLAVTMIFGTSALNALSTNVWFNLFFFVLLVVFGISFLGAFEITLPSSWVNKADKNADKGGLIGIFFMAATLTLVSFSCTGPIIGSLLVEASTQGGLSPFFGMFGFSLALALPFALFAAFPGWLNSLPQSGGWLNSVKVCLGLLEIAFSLKFLSNADLVVQAHLLEREIFLAVWIVIFAMLGFYLLGKIKFPHDSDLKHVSVPRFLMGTITLSLVLYMIPGLWGAPLKLISGFPPPITYSESPFGIGGSAPDEEKLPEGAHHGPHGLMLFHDLEVGMEYAKKVGKAPMLDFTGWACVNCRRMEENVWTDPEVLPILKDSVVIISLHVDDKEKLPEDQVTTSEDGFRIRTIGDKWSHLQKSVYSSQSQPQYFILTNEGERLGGQANYEDHQDPPVFKDWLDENLSQYQSRKGIPSFTPFLMMID